MSKFEVFGPNFVIPNGASLSFVSSTTTGDRTVQRYSAGASLNVLITLIGDVGLPSEFRTVGGIEFRSASDAKLATIGISGIPTLGTIAPGGILNTAPAFAGADTLLGTAGADRLEGHGSDDIIHSLGGSDYIDGGDGKDFVYFDTVKTDIVCFIAPDIASARIGGAADTVALIGIEGVAGGRGNDILVGNGSSNTLLGNEGYDFIFGNSLTDSGLVTASAGNDFISGNGGNDVIFAGDENDVIDGGAGDDVIVGGPGNDRLSGGFEGSPFNGAVIGNNFIFGGSFGSDGSRLTGSGHDSISAGDGRDALYGFDGDDGINAGGGNDYIEGGAGNDDIQAGDGSDFILGDDGNDTINSGAGFDYMYGGSGADTFIFRKSDSADWILDFKASEGDKLRLEAFGFAGMAATPFVDVSTPESPAVQLSIMNLTTLRYDQLTIFGVTLAELSAANVSWG